MSSDLVNRLFAGALSGFLSAAVVDVAAFRSWKRVEDAMLYNWRLAAFRWAQGIITGAIAGFGLGAAQG